MTAVHPKIQALEAKQAKPVPSESADFRAGDTVRVHTLIVEGDKERVQIFEGVVIRRKRAGVRSTFTVRKISYGVGVERIFPVHSPRVQSVEVVARGKVRRSKLYYLRDLVGKAARVEETAT